MDRNAFSTHAQAHSPLHIETCLEACREQFNRIVSDVISSQHHEAHQVEASLFKQLMQLGLLFLHLFFANHHRGDYGETVQTAQGLATRGRPSERAYFSIFGKLKIQRYLYAVDALSFAP